MRMRSAVVLLCLGAAGCGGAAETELFGAGTEDASGSSPLPGDNDGGRGTDGTVESGVRRNRDSGGPDVSALADASEGGDDAANPRDPGVFCGKTTETVYCTPPDICCVMDPSAPSYSCETSQFNCPNGVPVACDDEADCPTGLLCCGAFDQTLGYRQVTCEKSCAGPDPSGDLLFRFCNPAATPDECAAIGLHCKPSTSLAGYFRCTN
jgi:hypothetical protein